MTDAFDPTAIAGGKSPAPKKPKPRKTADVATEAGGDNLARDQLRALVERIETLNEEKATIAEDIKQVFAEAKGNGFDTKVLRRVIALRKQDQAERQEFEAILDLYLNALGMVGA